MGSIIDAVVSPPIISEAEIEAGFDACASDNPCEANWQRAYTYHADKMYDLAVFQALQGIVFGTIQYASADRNADLAYDLADRQLVIAEEEYARYKEKYAPCEDALAAEICAMECEPPDYDTRADRATRDVRIQFSRAREQVLRSRNRYCFADTMRSVCDMAKAEALATVQARDLAYRYAETRYELLDEKRWNRRLAIFQLGRDIKTGQSSDYTSALPYATSALGAKQAALDNFLGTLSGGIGTIANAYTAKNYYRDMPPQFGQGTNAFSSNAYSVNTPPAGGGSGMYSGVAPY